jgi:hypothetical protein
MASIFEKGWTRFDTPSSLYEVINFEKVLSFVVIVKIGTL